jgi:Cd2+/Zn2+-exporting ATPase
MSEETVPKTSCTSCACQTSGKGTTEPLSAGGGAVAVLGIEGMDCPTEEGLIRGKLEAMPEVLELQFNLLKRQLTLRHQEKALPEILTALKSIGMDATLLEEKEAGKPAFSRKQLILLGVGGAAAILAEAVEWTKGPDWLTITLALVAIACGGIDTYKKGWIALKNLNLNINALMSVAVTGGMLIGEWPEAAMVMFLFAVAEMIESLSLDRARHAIRKLMDLAPETGLVKTPEGKWVETPAKSIVVGSLIRVRPGDRIVLDGRITSGEPSINQAPITGESIPVEKLVGDQVFAGTINEAGEFEFEVTAAAGDSTLSRIIHAVEEAQGSRAPTQRFVDQFAKIYTPAVFTVALAMALLPPLILGGGWHEWIYKSLVLLVIACPCALVISTPVTIVSGLAAAARAGILIKGGVYLEQGRRLKILALDKTGTLTHGKPAVTDFIPLEAGNADELRRLAVSLAARSDHPVSRAIAAYGVGDLQLLELANFKALLGRGVTAELGGRILYLGNQRLAREKNALGAELAAKLEALEAEGKTAVLLMEEGRGLAAFGVADTIRETSIAALKSLRDLGVRTIMLTGDNVTTAKAIGRQIGIEDVRGEMLPTDKLAVIQDLADKNAAVGMVGDGINDAPALAKADIGFAMGAAGSDTALETADVALMNDDLRKLPEFIQLSKKAAAVLQQNICVALLIKLVFLALTFTGHATMWMAVFADMGASILVVLNGLRLLRPPRGGGPRPDSGPSGRQSVSVMLMFALLLASLDQLTKNWVLNHIPYGHSIPVIDGFFNISHFTNSGMAWGFGAGNNGVFIGICLIAVTTILMLAARGRFVTMWARSVSTLMLGGILGNFYDRLIHGHVIDLLDFTFSIGAWSYRYPTFNLADSFLFLAALLLIIQSLGFSGEKGIELTKDRQLAPVR